MPRSSFPDFRDLSAMGGSGLRPALLRELTDLYLQKPSHTPEEERLYTELALRLIEHVDTAERARLGARLANYPAAPMALMLRLAEPSPPVAPLPTDAPPPQYLPRLEEPARAQTLSDTFFDALPAERRLILLHLDYAPIAPAKIAATVDAVARLERAAMTRRREEFAATIEQLLRISSACARRIAADSSGEAVLAALKALDVPSPALPRILLFLDPAIGQTAATYFALVRLFDEIAVNAARRLVAIWRQDDPMVPASDRHQTHNADGRPSRARDFARHDARPTAGKAAAEDARRTTKGES